MPILSDSCLRKVLSIIRLVLFGYFLRNKNQICVHKYILYIRLAILIFGFKIQMVDCHFKIRFRTFNHREN